MSVTKLETNEKIDKPVEQQTNAALTNETLDAKPAVSKQEMAANTADLTKTGTLPEISMVNKDGVEDFRQQIPLDGPVQVVNGTYAQKRVSSETATSSDLYKPQRNGGENPLLDPTPIREQKGLLNKFEGPSPVMFSSERIAETKVDASGNPVEKPPTPQQIHDKAAQDLTDVRKEQDFAARAGYIGLDGRRMFQTDNTLNLWSDGKVSKEDIGNRIKQLEGEVGGRTHTPDRDKQLDSARAIQTMVQNPDKYKDFLDKDGNFTTESYKAGMKKMEGKVQAASDNESFTGETLRRHNQLESTRENDARAKEQQKEQEKAEHDKKVADDRKKLGEGLPDDLVKLAQVRKGEGPYQVAARLLSAGGEKPSHKEVMALTRAMQAQFKAENSGNGDMSSLKAGHGMMTKQNFADLLDKMPPEIQAKLRKHSTYKPSA